MLPQRRLPTFKQGVSVVAASSSWARGDLLGPLLPLLFAGQRVEKSPVTSLVVGT